MRYPLIVAGFIFLSWLLCGLVTFLVLTLVTPMDALRCLRVFFGPAFAMGAATGLFAFLTVEQSIRRVLPILFPQGNLPQATGSPTIRQRLLAVFFLVTILPLVLLGSVLWQQSQPLPQVSEQAALMSPLFFSIFLLVLGLLLSFSLSFAVAKSLVDPLHTLQVAMASLSRGQLETRVPVVSTDELGEVSRGFNVMAAELQAAYTALEEEHEKLAAALRRIHLLEQAKSALSQFVPLTVYRLIEESPEQFPMEKVEKDVSVLFLDIAGYVRLSEALDPATVNTLVETYFSRYVDAIYAQGGDINETAGNGLMVLFQQNDPSTHAEAAVRTALAILQQTITINRQLEDTSPPVTLRIGINSGLAAVGITKFQGVTGTRWTYTASGPITNIAAGWLPWQSPERS
jgi:class 3 adenylate cyclase